MNLECFDQGSELITLFHDFIENLSNNINQLKYARIADSVSRQFEDIGKAIDFMKDQEKKMRGQKESDAAVLFFKVSQAEKHLNSGNYNDCFDILDEV